MKTIQKAAVLGSGVMGSSIAAHLANVGIDTLLLDIVPTTLTDREQAKGLTLSDKEVRNRIASEAKQRLLKQKPSPLTSKESLLKIEVGNFEDDLERLSEVDWIIEVVVERLDIKKQMFEKIDRILTPGTIVSSNTSGISIEEMVKGRSTNFASHFLGTHFFNPPRYLKLLEMIPTKQTSQEVVEYMKQFAEDVLGKGIVIAKDTINFVANRIGTYGLMVTAQEMERFGLTFSEVDELTGPLIGRPKSATFRTLDVVGLDTFMLVADNVYQHVEGSEKDVFVMPAYMKKMTESGLLGSKTKQGFYVKKGSTILQLNPETMTYEPKKKLDSPYVASIQSLRLNERLKSIIQTEDQVATFIWTTFKRTLLYAAEKTYEIADHLLAIDEAMKWGFGWELGPFEIWDVFGLETAVEKMKAEGETIPSWIEEMLEKGIKSFYKEENGVRYYYANGAYHPIVKNEKELSLQLLKRTGKVVKENRSASLIDLGDDVLCLEFHTKGNALGLDSIQMIHEAIQETERNYKGLVIGNQGKNFCAGANLAMMLMEAQDDNFFELELVIRKFQQAMMAIKYAKRPIVAAPFQMTLGGGCEVCLPSSEIQAAKETYIGLVEVGVGLIPGGGGNKELYMKELERLSKPSKEFLQPLANKVFETIAMAKVSTSADEARELGYLSLQDGISTNSDHLLHDAKKRVLALADGGFQSRTRKGIPVVGETGYATLLLGIEQMKNSGYISDHDQKIAKKLAFVISGGRVPFGKEVDEQYLLDLEREAFLSLIGEEKTQARMQHMLLKGKPLRN